MTDAARGWTVADEELERLAQFLHRNFPAERSALEPRAVPRPVAIVNVAMKLLLRAFGGGGEFPVRYTLTGKMRHYLDPTRHSDKGEAMTFCGHRAYSLAEIVAQGVYNAREASKMRDADECPRCVRHKRSMVTITEKEMADVGRQLRDLADRMAADE